MKTIEKQYLFWDVDLEKMDPTKSRRFIIERILARGGLDDFRWAFSFFGEKLIKNVLINAKSLDGKSQNFWCVYFNVNKSKCTQNQLMKKQSVFWRR